MDGWRFWLNGSHTVNPTPTHTHFFLLLQAPNCLFKWKALGFYIECPCSIFCAWFTATDCTLSIWMKIKKKAPHLVNLPVNRNITKLTPLLWKSISFKYLWAHFLNACFECKKKIKKMPSFILCNFIICTILLWLADWKYIWPWKE